MADNTCKLAEGARFSEELFSYLSKFFGSFKTSNIIGALMHPPSFYSIRVNTLKASVEEVYRSLCEKNIETIFHPILDDVLLIKVKGPFEIEVQGKIVVADKKAAESVYVGADLYAPGVISAKGVARSDFVTIVDEKGFPVANGIAMQSEIDILNQRKGLAVKVLRSRYQSASIRCLDEYVSGKIYDQNIPAILTSIILEPTPHDVIVDMCAAPGGKTTHLAQLTSNKAKIYAFDNSKSKISKLIENINRLGVRNVSVIFSDSRYLHVDYPSLKADKVLLDPPCSALGVRPKLFEYKSVRDIVACAQYQMQFFKSAVEILKKGGILVYSTCTITPDENEIIVKYALENFPLELDKQILYLGTQGLNIIKGSNLLQRFYPDEHDTPGYFIAKFVKV
ncbi:MAG: methyltransferase domain-containing protein [archaeon YNP-WB-040]|jgi:16S rRNA (cytosine967-C5)-methyltransferase|nr:methyltransferase domain-containing protein [Candidatus Culexarchaeum yellowstonense]